MTKKEYLARLMEAYALVGVMSEKNDCEVLRLRNNKNGKDLVLRSFPAQIPAYEKLYPIKCENLPLIYDVIDLEDGQIVLEEYVDGITLAQAMENRKYTFAEAKPLLFSVCHALSVLHQFNLVHRDVKPENVMIDKRGKVILIDFNASREFSPAKKDTVVMGTIGFAPPEQLGIAQSDARTDIYAVGVILNMMITGKHPSEEIAKGRAGRIVRKCTRVNPQERYQTAKKLAQAL